MITPNALSNAKKLLQAAYPGIKWFEESWCVWKAALDDEGFTDERFIHAVRGIVKHEQWYQSTALPPLVKKHSAGYAPPERRALEQSVADKDNNLREVRKLLEMLAAKYRVAE